MYVCIRHIIQGISILADDKNIRQGIQYVLPIMWQCITVLPHDWKKGLTLLTKYVGFTQPGF